MPTQAQHFKAFGSKAPFSQQRNRAQRKEAHVSTKVRAAIREGLFDDTEDHKAGHLEASPTDRAPRRTERAVLLELVDYAGKDGRIYPSIERLADDLEMGERTVRRAIKCLSARGILITEVQGGTWKPTRKTFGGSTVYRLNSQLVQRYYEKSVTQPVKMTNEPGLNTLTTNTPLDTTTVYSQNSPPNGRGEDSVREKRERRRQDEAGAPILPPRLYRQEKPTRYRYTKSQVLKALLEAGSRPERAALWFNYAKPDRKTGLYAPRYGDKTINETALKWKEREIEDTGPLTVSNFLSRQQNDRHFNPHRYEKRSDGLFHLRSEAQA